MVFVWIKSAGKHASNPHLKSLDFEPPLNWINFFYNSNKSKEWWTLKRLTWVWMMGIRSETCRPDTTQSETKNASTELTCRREPTAFTWTDTCCRLSENYNDNWWRAFHSQRSHHLQIQEVFDYFSLFSSGRMVRVSRFFFFLNLIWIFWKISLITRLLRTFGYFSLKFRPIVAPNKNANYFGILTRQDGVNEAATSRPEWRTFQQKQVRVICTHTHMHLMSSWNEIRGWRGLI